MDIPLETFNHLGRSHRSELASVGVLELEDTNDLLSVAQLSRLEELSRKINLEDIQEGDAGDKHTLQVGRLLKAPPGQAPFAVSEVTTEVIQILSNPRLIGYLQGLLDTNLTLHYRRGQVNIIHENGFVGPHIDHDADPDYQLVLILHFNSNYTGGEYGVVPPNGSDPIKLKPTPHTLLIGRTDVNHWVGRISSGERRTLVMFVSTYGGPNRKNMD